MFKVPVSVLKECLANLETSKFYLEALNEKRPSSIVEKRLKRVKNNIKLLKANYFV